MLSPDDGTSRQGGSSLDPGFGEEAGPRGQREFGVRWAGGGVDGCRTGRGQGEGPGGEPLHTTHRTSHKCHGGGGRREEEGGGGRRREEEEGGGGPTRQWWVPVMTLEGKGVKGAQNNATLSLSLPNDCFSSNFN